MWVCAPRIQPRQVQGIHIRLTAWIYIRERVTRFQNVFHSPPPNGELLPALTFTVGSARIVSLSPRENARIIEIAYEKEKKRNSGPIIVSVQKKKDAQSASKDAIYDNRQGELYSIIVAGFVCACNERATTSGLRKKKKKKVAAATVTEASFSEYRQRAKQKRRISEKERGDCFEEARAKKKREQAIR